MSSEVPVTILNKLRLTQHQVKELNLRPPGCEVPACYCDCIVSSVTMLLYRKYDLEIFYFE